MSTADVLAHLPVFGQKAADVSKPARATKSTARRARPALRTYTPPAPESDAGHERRLEFERTERAVLKAAGYRCQVGLEGCNGRAVTAHHLKLRSQGGKNDRGNLVAICRWCHKRVHAHPAEAAAAGNIIRPKNG